MSEQSDSYDGPLTRITMLDGSELVVRGSVEAICDQVAAAQAEALMVELEPQDGRS